MATIYILLMIWTTNDYRGGFGIVQQEFSSKEACEEARVVLSKAHNGTDRTLAAQGCFRKK